ncbi:MAG: hypothetical protein AAFN92_11700, partial [Bacteroidota bacterium]
FPIGNDLLEVYNNMWTGVETVKFNGEVVSKQFNWFRGEHIFRSASPGGFGTDDFKVVIKMTYMGSIAVDVYRNGECLLANSCEGRKALERNHQRGVDMDSFGQPTAHRVRRKEPLWREEDLV